MPWLQITFAAEAEGAQPIADALGACGALSVSIEEAPERGAAEPPRVQAATEEVPLWRKNRITGLFPEYADVEAIARCVRTHLALSHAPVYRTDLLDDADWGRAWMAHYRPIQAGTHLWICPSWCEPPDPGAVNVILDPGLAFGTGEHPTTALCLEWLSQQDLKAKTFVDYGCGSGILAIAALKLGARSAIAVDIDPQALAVCRENADRNGVERRLWTLAPTELGCNERVDAVVANILANPLIELAPRLTALVGDHGRIALCGMLRSQQDAVQSCYRPRFELEARTRGEWVLLAGPRRAAED